LVVGLGDQINAWLAHSALKEGDATFASSTSGQRRRERRWKKGIALVRDMLPRANDAAGPCGTSTSPSTYNAAAQLVLGHPAPTRHSARQWTAGYYGGTAILKRQKSMAPNTC
jgi:hypothetical protein